MNFVELLKVVLLGVVEGVTEWLPISSTGHMLLVDEFISLDMSENFKEMFFVVIQFGAILAVLNIFWEKLSPIQISGSLGLNKSAIMIWLKVAVACIPTGILGFLLDDYLEEHFGTASTIAIMLIVYGVAFIMVENGIKAVADYGHCRRYSLQHSFPAGNFPVAGDDPGTSRSGATILGAVASRNFREAAVEFSFFLVISTMLGASLYKLAKFGLAFSKREVISLALGMAVAFFCIVNRNPLADEIRRTQCFQSIRWYRILLGGIIWHYMLCEKSCEE